MFQHSGDRISAFSLMGKFLPYTVAEEVELKAPKLKGIPFETAIMNVYTNNSLKQPVKAVYDTAFASCFKFNAVAERRHSSVAR